ncbi:thioredoxin family protein [Pelagovum sp. HNIBRBA483]|uniref:thioredoxin family protein n=1 Tax=Pelagovum sp. HNIBRBA483 TaxID=3233341 RepID=UPI0034A44B7A
MKRRTLLATLAAFGVLPAFAQAEVLPYTPGLVQQHLDAGETVFVDFYADWCSTCRAQSRVLDQLKADNPEYEEKITFIQVDWDQYSDGDLARRLEIPRRSTLVMLRGDMQLGRIVAGTRMSDIKALLDAGL